MVQRKGRVVINSCGTRVISRKYRASAVIDFRAGAQKLCNWKNVPSRCLIMSVASGTRIVLPQEARVLAERRHPRGSRAEEEEVLRAHRYALHVRVKARPKAAV